MNKIVKKVALVFGALVLTVVGSLGLAPNTAFGSVGDLSFNKIYESGNSAGLDRKENLDATKVVAEVLKYLMYAVGVVSVVMIIIGGIRYATSGGNAEKVKTAKNTILYACVGLAVALLALTIISFVQDSVSKGLADVLTTLITV